MRKPNKHIECGEQVLLQLVFQRGKQRVGLARPDDHRRCLQISGQFEDLGQNPQAVASHFGRRGGDINVDVRHVQGGETQIAACDMAAQFAPRRGVGLGGPQMSRIHHKFEDGEPHVGEMIDRLSD